LVVSLFHGVNGWVTRKLECSKSGLVQLPPISYGIESAAATSYTHGSNFCFSGLFMVFSSGTMVLPQRQVE